MIHERIEIGKYTTRFLLQTMSRHYKYGLICALVLLAGCELSGSSDSVPASQINILLPEDPWPMKDSFEVVSAEVEGDFLRLELAYSGGCTEHEFSFHSNGPVIETLPLTADLIIFHDANDDACDAWITEILWVDLKPIRSSTSREVRIHIVDGTHQGNTTVSYRY